MITKYFQIFVITLLLSSSIHAQQEGTGIENIPAYMDDLVRTERMYYNERNDTSKQLLLFHKYELNIKLEQLDEAEASLNRINTGFLTAEWKQEWFAEKAFIELHAAHYENSVYYAEQGLEQKSSRSLSRLMQLQVLGLIMLADSHQADSVFNRWAISAHVSPDTITIYRNMLNEVVWKDPEKARRRARILPGIGQWYAGNKRDGVVNTALLVLTIGGAAFLFSQGYIITPIITGGGLFFRFFMGGKKHAVALANNYNKNEEEYLFNRFRLLFLRST